MSTRSGASERVCRGILALYPPEFRRRFGAQLIQLSRDLLRDGRASGARFGVVRAWLRILGDAALTAPAEHLRRHRTVAHSLQSTPGLATRPIRYAWALGGSGVLYALFQASAVTDIGLGDDLWQAGMAMHGLIVVLAMVGLIGVGRSLGLMGWMAATWWGATVLAFLGLVVAHAFWSAALIGIASVLVTRLRATWAGVAIASGGVLWLYLYLVGARVGNEDGRALTSVETGVGLVALALMGVGFAAAGWVIGRPRQPALP